MSEWRETTLGEIVNFRRGHDLPKTKMVDEGVPVVGSNGIIGFHNEITTKAPCVSIGRSGNVGNPFLTNQDCWSHNTTLYIDDFKGNDAYFIYYFLITLNLKNYRGGSAVPTLNRNHIHPIITQIPPVPEQKAIAHILGTLDDKIELNRKMNQTLEAMAQALFKSWFVDFDPVVDNALAAGKEIPEALKTKAEKRKAILDRHSALDAESATTENGAPLIYANPELAKLFPSSFEYNETLEKWVPEGWEVKNIGDFAQLKYGTMPKKEKLGTGNYMTFSGYKYINKYPQKNCSEGTLIVVARGVGGTGDVKIAEKDCYLTNLSIMIDTVVYGKYLYYLLAPKGLRHLDSGSAQSQITIKDLSALTVEIAPSSLIDQLLKIESSLFKKRLMNKDRIETLTQLRDTLLPQLISGKVRVSSTIASFF
ncbi:restriction endonuclease S subunit [Owenweeksia hongkongensis DSM 17368]|uniref:Restriction endonuclease S subunit n=1 Tax=Owenweeksia hongkongensis (strain DSM 17368 / CIP 108786 / JCM 12287 / NRRL B-23963 / UST20020801) TaxID=926562 RepID=G8R517_OWEHD|nr:restriction endonuclease subunit S [Owenweeksia hongkongensis]AEV31028.1 restriction endonuclease S subunit [Owenweeksia hongkongensis DSM 17368]